MKLTHKIPLEFFILFSIFNGINTQYVEFGVGIISYLYERSPCISFRGACCTEREIPANFKLLQEMISDKVFGQPLVQNTLVNALKAHWNDEHKPDKALTLSFHGGTGVGKNYVVKFIQEALYSKGSQSPHVHYFISRAHFPEETEKKTNQENLRQWIQGNVSNCPKQLFIFDEVQYMPEGVLDVIKPYIDYVDAIDKISFKQAIFIFLSNTGSKFINEHAYKLFKQGLEREDLKLNDFEKFITQGAFNEKGGFHYSETIRSNLIDHYIPFLPMMEPQVRLCIIEEFKKRGKPFPSEKLIEDVLEFINWGPDETNGFFSKTGCKRISQKVALLVAQDND